MSPTPPASKPPARAPFRTIVRAAIPSADELDEDGWARLDGIVVDALARRSSGERRRLRLFVRVVGALALLRYGRPLTGLDAERSRRLLETLERSRFLLLRRGVWAVRTLAFMGYYGQPAVQKALGYGAQAGGWSARRRGDA